MSTTATRTTTPEVVAARLNTLLANADLGFTIPATTVVEQDEFYGCPLVPGTFVVHGDNEYLHLQRHAIKQVAWEFGFVVDTCVGVHAYGLVPAHAA